MTLSELQARLAVGRPRRVLAAMTHSERYPGFVRSVSVRPDHGVLIEFEQLGHDEGGAYFFATYASLEAAVAAVEDYVGRPVAEWSGQPTLDDGPADADPRVGHARLLADIASGQVALPDGAAFELRGGYWKQFEARGRP